MLMLLMVLLLSFMLLLILVLLLVLVLMLLMLSAGISFRSSSYAVRPQNPLLSALNWALSVVNRALSALKNRASGSRWAVPCVLPDAAAALKSLRCRGGVVIKSLRSRGTVVVLRWGVCVVVLGEILLLDTGVGSYRVRDFLGLLHTSLRGWENLRVAL